MSDDDDLLFTNTTRVCFPFNIFLPYLKMNINCTISLNYVHYVGIDCSFTSKFISNSISHEY